MVSGEFDQRVVDSVTKSLPELGGKPVEVTAVAFRVHNLPTLSLDEKIEFINNFADQTVGTIRKNSGTVDHFNPIAGLESLTAIFNQPGNESKIRAINTAIEAKDSMKAWANKIRRTSKKFKVVIGLAFGEALVGNIGTLNRMQAAHLGNPVDRAWALAREKDLEVNPNRREKIVLAPEVYSPFQSLLIGHRIYREGEESFLLLGVNEGVDLKRFRTDI